MIFDEIIGQEKAINRLKGYIDTRTVDGAFLFTGPAGVGKALCARSFAKALNCLSPDAHGCNECASCRKIDKDAHPDIHVIDSCAAGEPADEEANQIKIAQIRQLQEDIGYRPYEGRKKVFIINNAHQMNLEAANAFLKTLEEPPSDSVIILITDRRALLLPTVVSRCRIVKFYPLSRSRLEEALTAGAVDGTRCSQQEAHFLAYFSEGSLGTALRLRERRVFEEKNRVIDLFCGSARPAGDPVPAVSRQELLSSFNILASWFRDIYMLKTGAGPQELIHADRRDELAANARRYSFDDLDRIFGLISESALNVERNVNKKLLVSNMIAGCRLGPA
ncbi:MAG TPA: DNA polymerase III subunit delta' [Candidatus Omnitrophota bacterium]|nr:DNA polymerase III subunit delta' [Candidatus Omnitrophota bacterium]HQJ15322.1 DNA polymerase III subunit delta' [Candidatus Omnitrophota bacterium]